MENRIIGEPLAGRLVVADAERASERGERERERGSAAISHKEREREAETERGRMLNSSQMFGGRLLLGNLAP